MALYVVDPSSNREEQIKNAVAAIGRSTVRQAVFEAVYFGKPVTKKVSQIMEVLDLDRKTVLTHGKALSDQHVVEQVKKDGETAYSKLAHIKALRPDIRRRTSKPDEFVEDKSASLPARTQRRFTGPKRARARTSILFIQSNSGVDLATDQELRSLEKTIQALPLRDKLQLIASPAATADDFRQHIFDRKPDIVHFSGHGNSNGFAFNEGNHTEGFFTFKEIAALLTAAGARPKLVVSSSCNSGDGLTDLLSAADAAIGYKRSVLDSDALNYTEVLYDTLLRGSSLAAAVTAARIFIAKRNGETAHLLVEAKPTVQLNADNFLALR